MNWKEIEEAVEPIEVKIARVLEEANELISADFEKPLTISERDMLIAEQGLLIALIDKIGEAIGVEDTNQWMFDCGLRVCGTPQHTCSDCNYN